MIPIERYRDAQGRLCEHYGLDADSMYVDLENPVERVHYLQAGTGEPLVLVHGGAGSTAATWVPLVASLADRFRLLALDVPGDGLSDPFDFRGVDYRAFSVGLFDAFLDAVGIERATFVGNSRGGFQSLVVGLDRPDRVESIVLVGAVPGLSRHIPLALRLMGIPGLNRLLFASAWKPNVNSVRKLYDGFVVDDSTIPAVFYECLAQNRALPGRVESQRTWAESVVTLRGLTPEMLIRTKVSDLDIPVRFLWGERDGITLPSVGRETAGEMANAEFVELKNAGHMPWLEPDDRVAESIAEFVVDGSGDQQ